MFTVLFGWNKTKWLLINYSFVQTIDFNNNSTYEYLNYIIYMSDRAVFGTGCDVSSSFSLMVKQIKCILS